MHHQQPPTGPRPQPRKSNASLKVALVGCGGIVAVLGGVTVLGLVLQATGVVKPPPTREAFPPLSPAPATAAAKPLAKAVRPPVAEN
ncbi:MAG: hypothetical protein QOE54_3078, partial [Streptosporangiaceae bacterium]|nr:hypothetical protein [Streptosporangiaceae bacterium]